MKSHSLKIVQIGDVECVKITEKNIVDETVINLIHSTLSQSLTDNKTLKMIIDFDKVEKLSSAILGKLVSLNSQMKERGGEMILCNISEIVMQVFSITKLDKVLHIEPDAFDAMAQFSQDD